MPASPPGTTERSSSLSTPRQAGKDRSPAGRREESKTRVNSWRIRIKPKVWVQPKGRKQTCSDRNIASVPVYRAH